MQKGFSSIIPCFYIDELVFLNSGVIRTSLGNGIRNHLLRIRRYKILQPIRCGYGTVAIPCSIS